MQKEIDKLLDRKAEIIQDDFKEYDWGLIK